MRGGAGGDSRPRARPGVSRHPDAAAGRLRRGAGAGRCGSCPLIVFVTAFDEHALRAFEVHACDYLLKPFDRERFRKVLQHVRERLEERRAAVSPPVRPGRTRPGAYAAAAAQLGPQHLPAGGRGGLGRSRGQLRGNSRGQSHPPDPRHAGRPAAEAGRRDVCGISRSQIVRIDAIAELQPWFHGEFRVLLKSGATLMWTRRYRDAYEQMRERF